MEPALSECIEERAAVVDYATKLEADLLAMSRLVVVLCLLALAFAAVALYATHRLQKRE